ncbi:hypothetical protein GQ53DRAFT_632790, partial [Thozetella sp. PMI_491]
PSTTYGSAPVGIIAYQYDGYMSAAITSTDTADRPTNPQTDAEWAVIPKHIVMYSGTYTLSVETATTGHLVHGPIEVSAIPSMVGISLPKNYTLFDNGKVLRLWFYKGNDTVDVWLKKVG